MKIFYKITAVAFLMAAGLTSLSTAFAGDMVVRGAAYGGRQVVDNPGHSTHGRNVIDVVIQYYVKGNTIGPVNPTFSGKAKYDFDGYFGNPKGSSLLVTVEK